MRPALPERLPAPPIELHRWRRRDLAELMRALDLSFNELRQWMPWAQTPPRLEDEAKVLAAGEFAFDRGREWGYFLREVDGGELVGGAGLHPRVGPGGLEIGYWVRSDKVGCGYATAAARALTEAAFSSVPALRRVEVHMDRANLASAAIPRKLGFTLDREEDREVLAPGQTGRGYVWILTRQSWERLQPGRAPVTPARRSRSDVRSGDPRRPPGS